VIGGVNHVGVIGNAKFIQLFKQQANIDVYVFGNGGVSELKVIDAALADGSDGFRSRIFHTAATVLRNLEQKWLSGFGLPRSAPKYCSTLALRLAK
jgi:hypothetical protein